MTESTKNNNRRKVLIGMTAAFGAAGIPFAATPFIAAWNPSAKAKALGAAVKVDISKIDCAIKSKFNTNGFFLENFSIFFFMVFLFALS